MKKSLTILLFSLISLVGFSTTYYIDPAGNDGAEHTGLIGDPWRHLWYACTRVSGAGDIIHINSGSYVETTQMTLPYQVSLEGIGDDSHIISNYANAGFFEALILCGGGSASYPQTVSYLQLDGDNLTGYQAIGSYGHDYVYIHHCKVINFRFMGVLFGGANSDNNKCYSNTITNCAGGTGYGFGDEGFALKISQQTGFLCYSNTISQIARGTPAQMLDGCGLGGYEQTNGTKIYDNDIIWPARENTSWSFAIEIWWPNGMEIYGNTVEGEIDICKLIPPTGYSYSLSFHNNICKFDAVKSTVNYGLQLEANISDVYIYYNTFYNLACPIYFCNYDKFGGPGDPDEYVSDLYIYNNKMYNCGMSGTNYGWGIWFECGNNDDDKDPPIYYDNIKIWHNTIVAYSTNPALRGIDLPAHAQNTNTMNIEVMDNIIIGFQTAGITARQQDNDYTTMIDHIDIYDNILYGNGNSNNSYWVSFAAPGYPTNYNYDTHIKSDPLFVGPPINLHLSTGSPAIAAGTAVTYPYGTTDLDNVTWGTPPSIGCYEYISGGVIYYIDPAGDDVNGDGSSGDPWQTLSHAATHVTTAGNSIHVNSGTYNETAKATISLGVSIIGEGDVSLLKYTYVASNENDAAILFSSSGPTPENGNQSITYVKIDGNSITATRAICVNYRNNVTIDHVTITNFNYSGITMDASNDVYPNPPTSTYQTGCEISNCTITNCATRATNINGHLVICGTDNLLVHNNTFDQTSRTAGQNGNIITTNWNKRLKIYNNGFTKNSVEGTEWNFFFENWHEQGEGEIYGNTFNGGAVCDFVNVEKGSYAYGLRIYDNDFLISSQIAKGYRTVQALDFEERGKYQDIQIYKNHIKNYPNGIYLLATMNEQDVYIDNIYIYCNIFENIGYTDWDASYAIFVNGEQETYDYYANDIRICRNTIIAGSSTSDFGIRWQVPGATTNVTIRDNIFQGFNTNPIDFAYQLAAGYVDVISVENNVYYSNGTNAADYTGVTVTNKTEQNNVVGNPLFVGSGDFHLTEGSSAIDAGITVTFSVGNTDYDNLAYGSPPSIGVYEYFSGGPPPSGGTGIGVRNGKIIMKNGKILKYP